MIFPFALSIRSKNTIVGNINVFKNLNIHQLRLSKEDPQFNDFFIIWWGNLKTEIQMLSIQAYRMGMDQAYDRYQHIFLGLAL